MGAAVGKRRNMKDLNTTGLSVTITNDATDPVTGIKKLNFGGKNDNQDPFVDEGRPIMTTVAFEVVCPNEFEGSDTYYLDKPYDFINPNSTKKNDLDDSGGADQFESLSPGGIGGGGQGGQKNRVTTNLGGKPILTLSRANSVNYSSGRNDSLATTTNDIRGVALSGRFYSLRYRHVGTWKRENNVLILSQSANSGTYDDLDSNDNQQRRNKTSTDTIEIVVWCTGSNGASHAEEVWENPYTKARFTVVDQKAKPYLPLWLRPSCISKRYERTDVAHENFECSMCYFPLHVTGVGCMRHFSRRVCEHYIHLQCGEYCLEKAKINGKNYAECPLCGSQYNGLKELPDLARNPREWFQVADVDCSGTLEPVEIVESLGAKYPFQRHKLEEILMDHWFEWDPNSDGNITLKELVIKKPKGVKEFFVDYMAELRERKRRGETLGSGTADLSNVMQLDNNVPHLDTHPYLWFQYWDADSSGTLEPHELIRALIRTVCVNARGDPSFARAMVVRQLALTMWEECGFHPWDSIDFGTFIQPGGLADTFIHNLVHGDALKEGGNTFC